MKSTLIKKKKKKKNHEKIKTLAFLRFVSICSQIRGRQSANTTLIKKKKGRKKNTRRMIVKKNGDLEEKSRERGGEREREKRLLQSIARKKEERRKKGGGAFLGAARGPVTFIHLIGRAGAIAIGIASHSKEKTKQNTPRTLHKRKCFGRSLPHSQLFLNFFSFAASREEKETS